ncbi:hypothetical protein [Streptomyces sp. NPDC050388]|uniref:hypothetical protein n=1 Tax=Streptomyces sp. NPDC050388 TaxID=3155781 RepID=UPI00342BC731
MKRLAQCAVAVGAAAALTVGMAGAAHADAIVSNGFAYGGFISYGDDFYVEHYEGFASYIKWSTNYGRTGTCGATSYEMTCDENLAEGYRVTIRVCTAMSETFLNVRCSDPVSDTI